ncbi:unnamed protein product [Caenorhabditis auriculariae]|uniref:Uncharacterized protein n=1 Tax=Caenorhabditis auriculariae TaxID=2777116 RepID=A0A8S1H827_9PELO|nr:unnamed protein product [Caenorhabditis auriculariae]
MVRTTLLIFALSVVAVHSNGIAGPLSQDFQTWLKSNGYDTDNFVRSDYGTQGSYGGFDASSNKAVNTPVVFIHGNSDAALKYSSTATGWSNSVEYFLSKGYTNAELYATSWQDTNVLKASTRTHNCFDLTRLRRFLEAVLSYTKAPKISLITHSMGVTLGRKIIKGGTVKASDGNCDLGPTINDKIEVFLGLAGANYGLCNCEGGSATLEKTCNRENGLWPGDSCGFNYLTCGLNPLLYPCSSVTYSSFLTTMNTDNIKEADHVFSAWSHSDNVIEYNDMTWGKPTSLIPNSDGKKVYLTYTHMETKELTAEDQFTMVKNKIVPQ